jgi:hypothetical protein
MSCDGAAAPQKVAACGNRPQAEAHGAPRLLPRPPPAPCASWRRRCQHVEKPRHQRPDCSLKSSVISATRCLRALSLVPLPVLLVVCLVEGFPCCRICFKLRSKPHHSPDAGSGSMVAHDWHGALTQQHAPPPAIPAISLAAHSWADTTSHVVALRGGAQVTRKGSSRRVAKSRLSSSSPSVVARTGSLVVR